MTQTAQQPVHDFNFSDHGSVTLLVPISRAAHDWVDANLPLDALHWAGGIVVEPRFVVGILDGITNDGLTVN